MADEQGAQQSVPQPAPQPVVPQQAPAQKSNVWLWIIGGCLGILILIGVAVMGFGWWAAHKVKNAIKENQPKLEDIKKNAAEWSKNAEEWQKQAEEMQKNLPQAPDNYSNEVESE